MRKTLVGPSLDRTGDIRTIGIYGTKAETQKQDKLELYQHYNRKSSTNTKH